MKRDTVILLVAVTSGAVAFLLTGNYLSAAAQPAHRFVTVVKPVSAGALIQDEDVAFSDPVKGSDSALYFLDPQAVAGKEAVEALEKGTLVRRTQVRRPAAAALAASRPESLPIPAGMRGMTLSSSDIDNVPDMVGVGDYLDVLGVASNVEGRTELQTIVRGSQVLNLKKAEDGSARAITIALTPEDSESVSKAMGQGRIRLVVRPDKGDTRATAASLGFVEIIRGTNRERKIGYGRTGGVE